MKLTKTKVIVLAVTTTPALVALLLYAGLVFHWVEIEGGPEPTPLSSPEATKVEWENESQREFLEKGSFQRHNSFDEAEQTAGYHIPHASPEYPIASGVLLWQPRFERPRSLTEYTYPPLAPTWIAVTVQPNYFYYEGDKGATSGVPAAVGGKPGWMQATEATWLFVFACGSVDDVNVWCQVGGSKEIPWEAFDHFVSTLQ